jgi:serine/threonine-protein kinase HipA
VKLARVYLHSPLSKLPAHVGWLSNFGDVYRFQFANSYLDSALEQGNAPVLSQQFIGLNIEQTRQIMLARRDERLVTSHRLPSFFENLLPEGENRQSLAIKRGCDVSEQLELLVAAGHDLMGAIEIVPENNADTEVLSWHVTQDLEPIEAGSLAKPVADGFSLAGFVTKFSMVAEGRRYVIRKGTQAGEIIAKLPSVKYPDLVDNELTCYRLAQAVGIQTAVVKKGLVTDLDLGVSIPFTDYLHVERFDRSASPDGHSKRIHVEELTQVLGLRSSEKYKNLRPNMVAMLALLWRQSANKRNDVLEVFRRWTAFAFMGNTDAHAKNWAFIYCDGVTPSLSPAYDMVSVASYFDGTLPNELAVNKAMDQSLMAWSLNEAASLARLAGIPMEPQIRACIRLTLADASRLWPAILQTAPENMRTTVANRLAYFQNAFEIS